MTTNLAESTTRLAAETGMRVLLVPVDEPPMRFGTSVRTDLGVTAVPGAMTMTWIETADADDEAEVEERGAEIVETMAAEPGFIAFVGTGGAGRGHTFTAWTTVRAAENAVARNRAHTAARQRFLHGPLGQRGFTSLWVPHRLNAQHVRCPGCGRRHALRPPDTAVGCSCGVIVGPVSYF